MPAWCSVYASYSVKALPHAMLSSTRAHILHKMLGSAHLRMQSELLPSAWPVDDPSKDQSGNSFGSMLVIGF